MSSNSSSSNNCTDDFETIYPRTETEKKTDGSNRMSSDEILSLNDSDVSSASVDRIVLGDEPSFTIENCNLSENLGDKPARSEENDSVASECSSKNEEPLPTFSVVYESELHPVVKRGYSITLQFNPSHQLTRWPFLQ